MRVLLINDYGTPTAGAELTSLMLRDGLRDRGHDARLFASRARLNGGEFLADYECFGTTSRLQMVSTTVNLSAWWQLRRVLAAFRPDVVHVTMFLWQLSPVILPLLKSVPSLYYAVTYKAICPTGTKLLPNGDLCQVRAGPVCVHSGCLSAPAWVPLMTQMKLWRRQRGALDLIAVPSEAMKRMLIADGIAPVDVIPPGVPRQPARPPLGAPPTVAFAGRLVREKGVDILVRAFAEVAKRVPDARLLLVGDGPERESLQRLVAAQGLTSHTSMPGHRPRAELERDLAPAWVQAVPSRWAEPFGLVAPEAMMRGTAVVASDIGALPEIVQHGRSGLLVPPNNVGALADALLALLSDRTLAEGMGRAGREAACTRFEFGAWVSRLIKTYRTLGDAA